MEYDRFPLHPKKMVVNNSFLEVVHTVAGVSGILWCFQWTNEQCCDKIERRGYSIEDSLIHLYVVAESLHLTLSLYSSLRVWMENYWLTIFTYTREDAAIEFPCWIMEEIRCCNDKRWSVSIESSYCLIVCSSILLISFIWLTSFRIFSIRLILTTIASSFFDVEWVDSLNL